MFLEKIFYVTFAAFLTFAGSLWIDELYRRFKTDLTFPDEVLIRARFRKIILFIVLAVISVKLSPQSSFEAFYSMLAIFLLILITFTDLEQYMIFDAMTLPLTIVGLVRLFHLELGFVDYIEAAAISGGVLFLFAWITKGALGGGDIKLIASLGIWFGCQKLLSICIFGAIFGGVVALLLIIFTKKNRHSYFAYGPYFALTAIYFLAMS